MMVLLSRKKTNMQRNYPKWVSFHYNKGYLRKNTSNSYLDGIADIFDQGFGEINWLIKRLIDPTSMGVTANDIDITFEGNKVTIEPLFCDNPEDYAVEIDRQALLDLCYKWQKLVKQKTPEIIMEQDENGVVILRGAFNGSTEQEEKK